MHQKNANTAAVQVESHLSRAAERMALVSDGFYVTLATCFCSRLNYRTKA